MAVAKNTLLNLSANGTSETNQEFLDLDDMYERLYKKLEKVAHVMNDVTKNLQNIGKAERELEQMRGAVFHKMIEFDLQFCEPLQRRNETGNK